MMTINVNQLPLAPLGAGDLIDRAVRLYRQHFMTLIRITAPPVVISAIGSVIITIGWREFAATPSGMRMVLYFALAMSGLGLWLCGNLLSIILMGGATRNLVMHLLWNEPVSVRATYKAVRSRFWGLLGATLLLSICVGFCAIVAFVAWYVVFLLCMFIAIIFVWMSGWISAIVGALGFVAATIVGLWLFFFLAGKFVYVPQVMLVEGKGVFESLGRSMSLARGNVRRLLAITFFYLFATYSALMLLIIPLGWYGFLNGIDPTPWQEADWPAWYAVGYNVLAQSSVILLSPVWMLGLSLLYVDERVRHEGYDIELMASRQLGEMPRLADGRETPFAPALVMGQQQPPASSSMSQPWSPNSTLGLR